MFETTFTLERETPGTFRYKEDGDKEDHKIGALYIKKATVSGKAPQQVTVIVKDAAEATATASKGKVKRARKKRPAKTT